MRFAITPTGRFAVRRCADALSDLQLRLLSLADGSRKAEDLLRECPQEKVERVREALGDLMDLHLIAMLA